MPQEPKTPNQQARRGSGPRNLTALPSRPFKVPPPPRRWNQETRRWWATIWSSEVATLWLEADVPGLERLGDLQQLYDRAPSARLAAELRLMGERYGLSPASRRRLGWQSTPAAKPNPPRPRRPDPREMLRDPPPAS